MAEQNITHNNMKKLVYAALLLFGLSMTTVCFAQEPIIINSDGIEEALSDQDIYQIVEEMPSFPGGEEKLYEFIANNVQYPQEAKERGIQGRVFVGFIVERDGTFSNFKILRSIGGGCDEEAMRVIMAMPKWTPGKQHGKAVRVSYKIPIKFSL